MCLILFAYRAHPNYPLVLAANRDEFFDRPTRAAHFWEPELQLLAGRDERAGGTWLGITKTGRFAAITNFRQGQTSTSAPITRSRGEITLNFLLSNSDPLSYAQSLKEQGHQFEGFNVLLGDNRRLVYFSNKSGAAYELAAGIYGLSNHLLDTPWAKVETGKAALQQALQNQDFNQKISNHNKLLSILTDTRIAPDHLLPNTGFPLEKERVLSSTFISTDYYGTCCSTSLTIDSKNQVQFVERNYQKSGSAEERVKNEFSDRIFEFQIDGDMQRT
jgi:uncharacterized protein with NRDE domain